MRYEDIKADENRMMRERINNQIKKESHEFKFSKGFSTRNQKQQKNK